MLRAGGLLIVVVVALAGCGKSEPNGGATGSGGAVGSGGATGSGGGTSGNGASGMGASGTGGAAAGGAPVAGCEAADPTVTGSAAHAAALSVLTPMVPCGVGICHAGAGQANLVLAGVTDLKATLVGKPACEAPALLLVDPRGGDAALANSWLWQKLTAPAMNTDALIVLPAWGTPGTCPTMGFGPTQTMGFGDRMPYGSLNTLEAQPLAQIRNWISPARRA